MFLNHFKIIELEKMPAKRYDEAVGMLNRKIRQKEESE
jgi:hypothetical protein